MRAVVHGLQHWTEPPPDPSEAVVHGLLAQDHNPSLDWLAVKSRVLHGSGYWHRTVTPLDGFTA